MWIAVFLTGLLTGLLTCSFAEEVITFPENSTVVLGENATFTCTSTSQHGIVWRLNTSEPTFIVSAQGLQLNEGKIHHHGDWINETLFVSVLTILEIDEYNSTSVQCKPFTASALNDAYDNTRIAYLRVLNTPSKPADLGGFSNASIVVFSWSPSFSPYSIPVTYTVILEDQNNHLLYSGKTEVTSFDYKIPDRFCSVIVLKVYASNKAGRTTASKFAYYALTKPKFEMVADSFNQHVYKANNDELICDINFDPVPCLESLEYVLFLQDNSRNESVPIQRSSSLPVFRLNSTHIKENLIYRYRIRAVNEFNESSEIENEFYTTDVQMANATLSLGSVQIRCNLLIGSQSRGCHVRIVTTQRTIVHYNLTRIAGYNFAQGKIKVDAETLEVFDWEKDGSIGSIPINVTVVKGITTTLGLSSGSSDGDIILPVSLGILGGVILVIIVFVLVFVTCGAVLRQSGKGKKSFKESNCHSQLDYNPSPYEVVYKKGTTPPALFNHNNIYSSIEGNNSQYAHLNGQGAVSAEGLESTYSQLSHSSCPTSPIVQVDLYSQLGQERQYAVIERNGATSAPPNIHIQQIHYRNQYSTLERSKIKGSITTV